MRKLLATATLAIALATPASAKILNEGPMTGSDLGSSCRMGFDDSELKNKISHLKETAHFAKGMCLGYLAAYSQMRAAKPCYARNGVPRKLLADFIVTFLDQNRHRISEPAPQLIEAAMDATFSCKGAN